MDRRWQADMSWTAPPFSMATRGQIICFSTRLHFKRQFGILTTEPFLVAPTALRFPRTEPLLQATAGPAQADSTLQPLRSEFRSWSMSAIGSSGTSAHRDEKSFPYKTRNTTSMACPMSLTLRLWFCRLGRGRYSGTCDKIQRTGD